MDTTLEKRVLSRLNAQYVFMPSASGKSICEFLHNKLLLPEQYLASPSSGLKRKESSPPEDARDVPRIQITRTFGEQYNRQVVKLFGHYSEPCKVGKTGHKRTASEMNSETDEHVDENNVDAGNDGTKQSRHFIPGNLKSLINMQSSWGMDFE